MLRTVWRWGYEATFYLPGVQRDMNLLPTQSERDAARRYVWGKLFRSWVYWRIVLLTAPLMLGVMSLDTHLQRMVADSLGFEGGAVRLSVRIGYWLLVMFVFAYGGMWPLHRFVITRLREHLNARGVPVCLNCGYVLTGLGAPRCPECGSAAPHWIANHVA